MTLTCISIKGGFIFLIHTVKVLRVKVAVFNHSLFGLLNNSSLLKQLRLDDSTDEYSTYIFHTNLQRWSLT